MVNTKINIAGITFKNPVMTASGTFGSGMEYSEFFDLNRLGAVVTKGVSLTPWEGNPVPRVAETPSGMLNAIGLQNPGIELFIKRDLVFLENALHKNSVNEGETEDIRDADTKIIVNVVGKTIDDYTEVIKRLNRTVADMYEINVSCPNVKEGGIAFGQNPKALEQITRAVKKCSEKPVIMKLSPNVTSVTEMARAAESAGADAISLINTITAMKIDVEKRAFVLANKTGGLSGPAIRPVAVRMVFECAHAVKIPVIGMGGIGDANDALEFILAGAHAVAIGAAHFTDPKASVKTVEGIEAYMKRHMIKDINDLRGAVK